MKRSLRSLLFRTVIVVLVITATMRFGAWQVYEYLEWSKGLPPAEAHEEREERHLVLILEIVSIAFLAFMLWRMVTTMLRPLRAITATAGTIAGGQLQRRIPLADHPPGELREIAALLNESFDRYQDALDRVSRFSSSASHQLRQPLTIIRATAELGLAPDAAPAQTADALDTILTEATHLDRLVAQLLLLARLDTGALRTGFAPVDLNALAGRALELFEPLLESRRLHLYRQLHASAPVLGDATLLAEVFTNLLDNAIKVSPDGGSLHLETRTADGNAFLRVVDGGPGISPAFRAHLFERFSRDPSATYRGSGLGLSIAREVVVAHGGTIEAQSPPQGGTAMEVRLPVLTGM